MLTLISPAKKLDFDNEPVKTDVSQPELLDHSEELVETIKAFSPSELQNLMKLSDKLVELNYQRYREFKRPFTQANARTALSAFKGDTYVGLDAETLSSSEIAYAQDHLRILSGLYGLLRPRDLIQAYRLEMGTRLSTYRGKNLYDFWGDIITNACNEALADHQNKTIVSLASNEYIKAVRPNHLDGSLINCEFKELKNNELKNIGLFSKRARGMMARHIIQNRIDTPEGLKDFREAGYVFDSGLSKEDTLVFVRDIGHI